MADRVRQDLRHLQDILPAEHPVFLRRVELRDCYGCASLVRHRNGSHSFLIQLDRRLSGTFARWVLIHEYAHCLAWDRDEEDHGPEWGKAYALAYQELLDT